MLFSDNPPSLPGIPNQTASDHGSETTQVYGIASALRSVTEINSLLSLPNMFIFREIVAAEIPEDDAPAHVYLQSVHNIVIE